MAIENGLIIKKGDKIYESKELRTKALQIVGFKKFILEYSLIRDRELQEVKIWEEYLVVAHLLGIAKKVRKNLKKRQVLHLPSLFLLVDSIVKCCTNSSAVLRVLGDMKADIIKFFQCRKYFFALGQE